jgi:molybdate transport system permease protein
MTEADDLAILALTLQVALAATMAIVPFGLALAWTVAQWRGRSSAKVAIEAILALPLVLPPTAVGIVLLMLLGKDGVVGRWLEALGIELVFTWRAAALASAVMAFPLFVRSARTPSKR